MAGIAGWVDWERDVSREPGRLLAMSAALAHRGREAAGMWVHPPAALLSRTGTFDIDGQPAAWGPPDEDGIVLAVDGVPTNIAALRRELRADPLVRDAGHAAAVLLAGYRRWGASLADRLTGPFALAVWDAGRQRLVLARDRLGVRPLFFAVRGQGLLFASELKGLLAHPAVPPELDAEGLAELLALSPNRTPGHGVFRGVREVVPGGIVCWDRDGLHERRYWQLTAQPHRDSPAETIATVRALLSAAVRGEAEAAAERGAGVGSMLSGGLDSTAVVALLLTGQQAGGNALRTYSLEHGGSDDHFRPNAYQPDSDRPWVERAVAHYRTQHETVMIDPLALADTLPVAMQGRDLPGMADIDAALYVLPADRRDERRRAVRRGRRRAVWRLPVVFPERTDAPFPVADAAGAALGAAAPGRAAAVPARRAARGPVRAAGGGGAAAARRRRDRGAAAGAHVPQSDRLGAGADRAVRPDGPAGGRAGAAAVLRSPASRVRVQCPVGAEGGGRRAQVAAARGGRRLAAARTAAAAEDAVSEDAQSSVFAGGATAVARAAGRPGVPLAGHFAADALQALASDPSELDLPWFGQLMRLPQLLAWLLQFDAWLEHYRVTLR